MSMRIRARVFMYVSAFACARGIDNPLDEPGSDGSPPVTIGTGAPTTVGPGSAGGAVQGATTSAASSVGAGGSGGTASAAVGAGGSTGTRAAGSGGAGTGSGGDAGASGGGSSGAGGSAAIDGGADAASVRPTGVHLGLETPSEQQAPTVNGTAFRQTCATDEVVIGYTATIDAPDAAMNQLRSFRAVCASLSVSGTFDFVVNTTSKEMLPVVGTMPGATQQTSMCPTDQVVIGFSGRSGADIDQIVISCAPLLVTGASPSYALSIGSETSRPPVGGPGGEPFAAIRCPPGQIAMGDGGRAAFTINAFGLLCATPSLEVK